MSYTGKTLLPFKGNFPLNLYVDNFDESGAAPPPPPTPDFRIIDNGDFRITDNGDFRIVNL